MLGCYRVTPVTVQNYTSNQLSVCDARFRRPEKIQWSHFCCAPLCPRLHAKCSLAGSSERCVSHHLLFYLTAMLIPTTLEQTCRGWVVFTPPHFTCILKSKHKANWEKKKIQSLFKRKRWQCPGIAPFSSLILTPITIWVTGRWGWEKREQRMFQKLPAKQSGRRFTSGRENIHVWIAVVT